MTENLNFIEHRNAVEMSFLNLDRKLNESDFVEPLLDNESIRGISLSHNFLLQIPKFVSNLTNLVEFHANFNELYEIEFLLQDKTTSRPLIHPFLEQIHLSHNHIENIPSKLHFLRFLRTLDLSHNFLRELPSDFTSLDQLEVLRLNNNQLIELPRTFSNLTQLKYLNLSSNQLESIDSMKNLSKLVEFHVDSNPLKRFPRLLSSCSNLEEISFSKTNLSKLDEIHFDYFHQFGRLKRLDLSKNQLENQFFLSNEIRSWTNVERLNLNENQLSNLNSILFQLKSLRQLDLSRNCLTRLPQDLPSNLTEIRFSSNQIEIYSDDCRTLKHLIHLELDQNEVKDLPDEFLQCFQLRFLNISSNPFVRFPDVVLRLKSIETFVYQNGFCRILPVKDLFQRNFSRTLNKLDFSHQQLRSSLNELTVLKRLTHLNLSHNQLELLDDDFRLLTCLKSFKLNHNKFTKVPLSCLGENLVELTLNNNQIKTIPDEFVRLTNLKVLDLSNNQFPSFPQPIVRLDRLTSLNYSQKSGIRISTLPDQFDRLFRLKKLNLSSNIFAEVPVVIYNLRQLVHLDFSENLLTGIEFKRLTNLKSIKLNENYFSTFSSSIFRFETFEIRENSLRLSPPNDSFYENSSSVPSRRFVDLNDEHDEKLFLIYKQILLDYLPDPTIERLLIRLKLSLNDIEEFRRTTTKRRREEKIDLLVRKWKEKRDTLADAETLFRLIKIIGDKKLLNEMQRAKILAEKVRI